MASLPQAPALAVSFSGTTEKSIALQRLCPIVEGFRPACQPVVMALDDPSRLAIPSDGYKLTVPLTTDFSTTNIEISSDAYAALWMPWDALAFQQSGTAVLSTGGRLAEKPDRGGALNSPTWSHVAPPKRGYKLA
jgi:hypothetical protein